MLELSSQQIMILIQIASKACEFEKEFIKGLAPNIVVADQVSAAINQAIIVFGQLDETYPGLMPLPHDGISWKEKSAQLDKEDGDEPFV